MKIPTVNFLGISFVNLSRDAILEYIRECVDTYEGSSVRYIDDRSFFGALFSKKKRQSINQFSLVIPREAFLIKLIRSCYRDYAYKSEDALDLVSPILSAYKEAHHSFMFFGAGQLGLNKLGINLQVSFPGVTLMGLYSRAFVESRTEDIRALIHKGDVRLMYLGMGSPRDEQWYLENRDILPNTVVMCVDKDIQNMTGEVKGIPLSVRKSGKEASYRFFRNPLIIFLLYRRITMCLATIFFKISTKKTRSAQ